MQTLIKLHRLFPLTKVAHLMLRFLFKDKGARPYTIKAFGKTFALYADWRDYQDATTIISPLYEKEVSRFLHKNLRRGEVFVNIGSNIGYFPLLVDSFERGNLIISVEPSVRNTLLQRKSIVKNDANIVLVDVAVGKRSGPTNLVFKPHNSGSGSTSGYLGLKPDNQLVLSEPVEMKTLPEITSEADILLMDVQGGELEVLEGALKLIKTRKLPCIVMEFVETEKGFKATELLSENGYQRFEILENGELKKSFGVKHKRSYVYQLIS